MEAVIVDKLKSGDRFLLDPSFEIWWTIIDRNPRQYTNSVLIKGVNITAPLDRCTLVYIQR